MLCLRFVIITAMYKNSEGALAAVSSHKTGSARMKLRTLLSKLGYKKRSKKIIRDIYDCLLFYHIETSLKGNIPCSVETVDIDDMLTFKTV